MKIVNRTPYPSGEVRALLGRAFGEGRRPRQEELVAIAGHEATHVEGGRSEIAAERAAASHLRRWRRFRAT